MKSKRNQIIITVVIGMLLLGLLISWGISLGISVGWQKAESEHAKGPSLKQLVANSESILPLLDLTDLDGKHVELPGTGGYRVINYWAAWCAPCLMEMPLLDQFAQSQNSDGVMVIGIALDEPNDIKNYLKQNPLKFPQFLEKNDPSDDIDSYSQLSNQDGMLPFSVLVGPDGRILKQQIGEFSNLDELEAFSTPPKP